MHLKTSLAKYRPSSNRPLASGLAMLTRPFQQTHYFSGVNVGHYKSYHKLCPFLTANYRNNRKTDKTFQNLFLTHSLEYYISVKILMKMLFIINATDLILIINFKPSWKNNTGNCSHSHFTGALADSTVPCTRGVWSFGGHSDAMPNHNHNYKLCCTHKFIVKKTLLWKFGNLWPHSWCIINQI